MSFIPIPVDADGNFAVSFADTAALDAFQRLRVSQSTTLYDSQQEYGLDTLRSWDCTANGTLPTILSPHGSVTSGSNAVGPRNLDTRMVPITCSSTNGHYSILQSRQFSRYIPGFAQLILMTGVFATNASYTAAIKIRTSTSGSVSDASSYEQANWYDKFDGTGPSGITLDLTKTQILFIGAQWLGAGRVIVGFDIDGRLYPAMFFNHANNLTVPYTQTFNLPVRLECETVGATTLAKAGYYEQNNGVFLETTNTGAGGTMQFLCCSVQSEGASEARGFPQSQSPGIGSYTVTTRRPIISIRPAATFQGLTNRAHIELAEYWLSAATNSSLYEVVIGGTLTGASWLRVGQSQGITAAAASLVVGARYVVLTAGTSTTGVGSDWSNVGAGTGAITAGLAFTATSTGSGVGTGTVTLEVSCAEYDTSATAIVGGGVTYTGEVPVGSGAIRGNASNSLDFRNPLVLSKINSLAATQLSVTIVCTSTSGNSVIRAGFNWHEQTN